MQAVMPCAKGYSHPTISGACYDLNIKSLTSSRGEPCLSLHAVVRQAWPHTRQLTHEHTLTPWLATCAVLSLLDWALTSSAITAGWLRLGGTTGWHEGNPVTGWVLAHGGVIYSTASRRA
jgi:thiosulfate reductase cytochrome b subunit